MNIPKLGEITDLLGVTRPGFYWQGIPYTLSSSCSQEQFDLFWRKGWNAAFSSHPNCAEHYNEPFCTIYGFAYRIAPKNPANFRAIALEALRSAVKEISF